MEKAEEERLAAEKAEEERLAIEKAEAARKAEEERLAAEAAEEERLAAESRAAESSSAVVAAEAGPSAATSAPRPQQHEQAAGLTQPAESDEARLAARLDAVIPGLGRVALKAEILRYPSSAEGITNRIL